MELRPLPLISVRKLKKHNKFQVQLEVPVLGNGDEGRQVGK